ncbi:MAG: ABC transporter ATP-binding protein [Anaerolineales bacterium]
MAEPLLELKDLAVQFHTDEGVVHAVNGVSLKIEEGETVAIVGESGSGKSVTVLATLKLIPSPPGEIIGGSANFFGRDLIQMESEEINQIRGSQIGMIFQDPLSSLNPVLSIGKQLTESMMLHLKFSQEEANHRAAELLEMVGIPNAKDRLNDYPHQFSGGMRQRVMIAMALSCNPQILIADEPTTALDVTIQAQFVELVKRLRKELGLAIIWITHDLGIVAGLAKRVIVMYGGYFVEEASVKDLYANPLHPYTLGLLKSLPRLDAKVHHRLLSIDGIPPVLYEIPTSCPFAPRCAIEVERCRNENPPLELVAPNHRIACWVDVNTGEERS